MKSSNHIKQGGKEINDAAAPFLTFGFKIPPVVKEQHHKSSNYRTRSSPLSHLSSSSTAMNAHTNSSQHAGVYEDNDVGVKNNTFEDVFIIIGRRGRFQLLLMVMILLVAISLHYQNVNTVFTLTTPKHRCKIPGLSNDTYATSNPHQGELVQRYIPQDGSSKTRQCELRLGPVYNATQRLDTDIQNTLQVGVHNNSAECSEWVYDKSVMKRTLVSDLDLVCSHTTVRSHVNMVLFCGKIAAAIIQGQISDRFGRRTSLMISVAGLLVAALGSAFVFDRMTLFIARFMAGFFATCCYLSIVVIGLEILSIEQRSYVTILTKLFDVIPDLSMALLAFLLRDWQYLQLFIIWPVVLALVVSWFIPESPRWLINKGRIEEAEKSIQLIGKINKKVVPKEFVRSLGLSEKAKERQSVLHLFGSFRLTCRWIVVYINWMVVCMVNYGLTFNISNMRGNIFANYAISAILDAIASLCVLLIVNRFSRKYLYVCSVTVGASACLATFIPNVLGANYLFAVALSLIGKAVSQASYSLLYTFSAELYPTSFRSVGLGSCSMMSRFGGLISPYIADLNMYASGKMSFVLPQLVFGTVAIAGGLTALTLPETKDRDLPETIEDIKQTNSKEPKVTLVMT